MPEPGDDRPGLSEGVAEPAQTTGRAPRLHLFPPPGTPCQRPGGQEAQADTGPEALCRSRCSEGNLEMLCRPGRVRGAQERSRAAAAAAAPTAAESR